MCSVNKYNYVPLSPRAVIQRINRALLKQGEVLRASRGWRAQMDVGHYFLVDIDKNFIVRKDVDLERMAKELGVLKPYEKVALA
jgi:hypothetical protein